jgi:uncharacterized protein
MLIGYKYKEEDISTVSRIKQARPPSTKNNPPSKSYTTSSTSPPEKVSFFSPNLKIAAQIYHPTPNYPNRSGAAVVICHPWTSIKEQSPANYARVLSQAGFICLAYDAAYQGESEGEPRSLENPAQRVEDNKSAVTYLTSLKDVNPNMIGVLGICASGG